jgi:purine-binding chemotaxis protein CheW
MKSSNYLIFGFNGLSYALPAVIVLEIIPLPELSLTDEIPSWIRGVFSLRGKFIPVIDLEQRINNKRHVCKTTDNLIILSKDSFQTAIIVSEVFNVVEIGEDEIKRINEVFPENSNYSFHFIEGITNNGGSTVTLLSVENILSLWVDPSKLFNLPEESDSVEDHQLPVAGIRYFSPESSNQEKIIFKERADSFREIIEIEDSSQKSAYAVVKLGDEFLGIALKTISGFSEIKKISRVPCCPSHIPGQINYHGKIITLVDMSPVFKLKPPKNYKGSKVIIVNLQEGEAGVLVDDVEDVVYLKISDISPSRSTINLINDSFQKGTVHYKNRMLTLIDLERVLLFGNLSVNDEV